MELSNPLSIFQLDKLRPLPLVVDFTHVDLPGPLLIGEVPAGHIVKNTVVWIREAFDGGLEITVGDLLAQARLQTTADNQAEYVDHFNVNNVHEYETNTDVYVFFPTGTPTTGRGRVIVFLD